MNPIKDFEFQKHLLWFNGLLPLIFLVYDWVNGNLGANPQEAFIRSSGVVAIIFIVLTLAVTPLVRFAKWSWLARHRRWLGLFAFYYAFVHMIAYSVLDKNLSVVAIKQDILKRPFILIGFLALLMMLPLAITSTNEMIRKLGGKKWKRLHRLTYVIALLACAHYWLIVKSDIRDPRLFLIATLALLVLRLPKKA